MDHSRDLVLFSLVTPPLQPGVVGTFSGTGCMVLQSFAAGGNQLYPEFWAVTDGPRYPGYIAPTIIILEVTQLMFNLTGHVFPFNKIFYHLIRYNTIYPDRIIE
jgi:hypothetical protein